MQWKSSGLNAARGSNCQFLNQRVFPDAQRGHLQEGAVPLKIQDRQPASMSFTVRSMQTDVFDFGKQRGQHINQVGDGYLGWKKPCWKAETEALTRRGKRQCLQSLQKNVHELLSELKGCAKKRDLQKGRRLHASAVESGIVSNMYIAAALINMYAKCRSIVDARTVFDTIQEPDLVCWNALIQGYAENGQGLVAMDLFFRMKEESKCVPNSLTHIAALKACTSLAADADEVRKRECLGWGRKIHLEISSYMDHFMQSRLIKMYSTCGSMEYAKAVFDSIQEPDVVSWNALILGYADNGHGVVALDMFSRMKEEGRCLPDSFTYVAALKACTSLSADADKAGKAQLLERGRALHLEIGHNLNIFLQNSLIDMYAKCGCMVDARAVFDSIHEPDLVSWNALILGYAENGEGLVALTFFSKMKDEHKFAPDSSTYVAALKACTSLAADRDGAGKGACLEWGRKMHLEIGHRTNNLVQTTLINMYAKCGFMVEAKMVFDSIQGPDVVSWTALILGYAESGQGLVALDLFSKMKEEPRCKPNSVTYVAALKACALLAVEDETGKEKYLERGREIHLEVGCDMDRFLQVALIDMYAKCGSMEDARREFDSIEVPDVVCWNALLQGYAENGQGLVALDLFSRMKGEGRCVPDSMTYVAALKACTSLAAGGNEAGQRQCLELGGDVHLEIGCHMNRFLQNMLIDMYAKCRSMVEARIVFDSMIEPDLVSWNSLILGYAEDAQGFVALNLFFRMQEECRCTPDSLTYVAVLKACSSIGALSMGRRLHSEIGELMNTHLVTCLVDFYAKCGSMEEARQVFDLHSRERNVSTWNALLAGYGRFGDIESVFNLFEAMQDQGFQANAVTFVCMLSCCSHAGLVEKAWEYLKVMPMQFGVTHTVKHYNCMIDLLGRANNLDQAVTILQRMPCDPDAVSWTTLLCACDKWKTDTV